MEDDDAARIARHGHTLTSRGRGFHHLREEEASLRPGDPGRKTPLGPNFFCQEETLSAPPPSNLQERRQIYAKTLRKKLDPGEPPSFKGVRPKPAGPGPLNCPTAKEELRSPSPLKTPACPRSRDVPGTRALSRGSPGPKFVPGNFCD